FRSLSKPKTKTPKSSKTKTATNNKTGSEEKTLTGHKRPFRHEDEEEDERSIKQTAKRLRTAPNHSKPSKASEMNQIGEIQVGPVAMDNVSEDPEDLIVRETLSQE